ncbi:MAG TPA: hypothetical protein V6D20_04815 [Candidatus Obscuribacterales bacterium]
MVEYKGTHEVFAVNGDELVIPPYIDQALTELVKARLPVTAIRLIKGHANLGLIDAKKVVDVYREKYADAIRSSFD